MTMYPTLPEPRGPLSETVTAALTGGPPPEAGLTERPPRAVAPADRPPPNVAPAGRPSPDVTSAGRSPREVLSRAVDDAEPLGEDLQLALYVCYELHYRGFDQVDPQWEWDPELLWLRRWLEDRFLSALRADLPGGADTGSALGELLVEDPGAYGVSHHLLDTGRWWEMREYLAHRSIYHLKEADPHAWVIPRLQGESKAALVAVEFDEFGGGRAERMHAKLFADLLDGAGLDSRYGHYLDHAPAQTLATVNLMSLFGLHRALRGALVGHFAAAEIATPPAADRLARALNRLGAGPECTRFFTEHIEADAVHEQVMRRDVIGDLLSREPELAADVVLGIQATAYLGERFSDHLLECWRSGRTSLRRPLP